MTLTALGLAAAVAASAGRAGGAAPPPPPILADCRPGSPERSDGPWTRASAGLDQANGPAERLTREAWQDIAQALRDVFPELAAGLGTPDPPAENQDDCQSAPSADAPPADAPPTVAPESEARFRLCSAVDPHAEREIEQFIAGRSYSATLVSRSDACPTLTITLGPPSYGQSAGRQSTTLSVGAGGPAGTRISVEIVTEGGRTRARIGSGR